MRNSNDNREPTVEIILETRLTLQNYIYNKKSITSVRRLLNLIYGRQLAQPYNRMITKFSKSSPLIAIAGDGAIIEYAVPNGEVFGRNNMYNVIAYTKE